MPMYAAVCSSKLLENERSRVMPMYAAVCSSNRVLSSSQHRIRSSVNRYWFSVSIGWHFSYSWGVGSYYARSYSRDVR